MAEVIPRFYGPIIESHISDAAGSATPADGSVTTAKLATGAAKGNLTAGSLTPDLLGTTVYNGTGGTLAAGTLVYMNGYNAANGCITVAAAACDIVNGKPTYVLTAAILNGAVGTAAKRWLSGATLNTNAFGGVGSLVYVTSVAGGAGTFTDSPPYRQDPCGVVVVKSATVGQIYYDLTGQAGTLIYCNKGDLADGTLGTATLADTAVATAKLANGAVTGVKASTVMATKTLNIAIGTISDTANEETLVIAPFAGTLTAAKLLCKDALAASDTKYVTFAMTNKGQAGAGSTAMLSATASGTTKATGGGSIAAYTTRDLPLHATAGNATVAAFDALVFTITETGTLTNTVTEGILQLQFLVTA